MKALTECLRSAGLNQVTTYIASGNILFRSERQTDDLIILIKGLIEKNFGFRPAMCIIGLDHLQRILEGNPFRHADQKGKSQHIFFFTSPPSRVDRELLDRSKQDREAYHITNEVLYLFAPDGIGRSKLAERIGRAVTTEMTARNLNTLETLLHLAQHLTST